MCVKNKFNKKIEKISKKRLTKKTISDIISFVVTWRRQSVKNKLTENVTSVILIESHEERHGSLKTKQYNEKMQNIFW